MPIAKLRGANLNYEVLGSHGPWVALSPGGRRALDMVKSLAQRMADAGYRVLIHDRRNCGVSDIVIGGKTSEYEIWADDLYELLSQLNGLPAVLGGGSSGCRLSLLFALKYPQVVRALLLWRVTGGAFAAQRLTENYYGQYIRTARQGGMAAVCELDHFKERIAARPSNRETLMSMKPEDFIAAMERWEEQFHRGAELPVIGVSEKDLRSIKVPTGIIPGNDRTHNHSIAQAAHRMIAGSELHDLFPEDLDVDSCRRRTGHRRRLRWRPCSSICCAEQSSKPLESWAIPGGGDIVRTWT
jgi:pimeloyl-ACP methyl ester carboxylesterase